MAKEPQLVTPLDKIEGLPPFEGMPVIAVGLEIRGVQGGFNDGLTVEPVVMHHGDRGYALLEFVVDDINHKSIAEANAWRRNHVVKVVSGTLVDKDFAADRLEAMQARIEEAKGVQRLPYGDELQEAHDRGEHAEGVVEGCPDCDREVDLAEQEAGGDGD